MVAVFEWEDASAFTWGQLLCPNFPRVRCRTCGTYGVQYPPADLLPTLEAWKHQHLPQSLGAFRFGLGEDIPRQAALVVGNLDVSFPMRDYKLRRLTSDITRSWPWTNSPWMTSNVPNRLRAWIHQLPNIAFGSNHWANVLWWLASCTLNQNPHLASKFSALAARSWVIWEYKTDPVRFKRGFWRGTLERMKTVVTEAKVKSIPPKYVVASAFVLILIGTDDLSHSCLILKIINLEMILFRGALISVSMVLSFEAIFSYRSPLPVPLKLDRISFPLLSDRKDAQLIEAAETGQLCLPLAWQDLPA